MTGSGSDGSSQDTAFVERDDQETHLPFDKGGVPFYIAILWAGFIIAYIAVMTVMALPDLRAWMAQ